jgi:hypothetical protein
MTRDHPGIATFFVYVGSSKFGLMAMNFLVWSTIWGVSALLGAAVGGLLAWSKNRDYSLWMGWAFIFPPIVLVYAFLPKNRGPRFRQPTLDEVDHSHD